MASDMSIWKNQCPDTLLRVYKGLRDKLRKKNRIKRMKNGIGPEILTGKQSETKHFASKILSLKLWHFSAMFLAFLLSP